MKIKAFLLTIVVIFSVFCTVSCKNKDTDKKKDREYNEQEVLNSAVDLIKKSEVLNEIYYGHGIECDTGDINNSSGYYFPADILSLNKFGIEKFDDIKTLTRACFTEAQSDLMINTVLNSVKDTSGNIINLARYYPAYDTLNPSVETCIMVYSKYNVLLKDEVEYLYDTVRVSDVDGDTIYVEIDVKVKNSKGSIQEKTLKIGLIEENNGFRIDTPTYARNSNFEE